MSISKETGERCDFFNPARQLVLTGGTGRAKMDGLAFGGAPVSTWEMRQRRHAEDDALASLIIASNKTANEELALAA